MDPLRMIRRQQGEEDDDESSTTGRGIAGTSATTTAGPPTTAPISTTEEPTTAPTTTSEPTTSAPEPTTEPTTERTTTSASRSTVTQVITPTTVIVIGTQTITSDLPATTLTSTSDPTITSSPSSSSSSSSSLSSGARAGIIAGSVIGGLALATLFLLVCLGMRRKRRKNLDRQENIKWPEIAASAEDRAALYPEQTHATGRAGIGGDDMEEVAAPAMMAGAAGVGTAYAGAGRYNSTSTNGRQPTLPSVPPSAYSESAYGGMSQYSSAPASSYGGAYASGPASTQSHTPLAPGPASIDYQRSTPSPPRAYVAGGSSNGHGDAPGALPLPGSELGQEEVARPSSPTPLQVGPFGNGYDESGTGGWRLSVVNDDPRERD